MVHESKQLRDECRDDWLENQIWNKSYKWICFDMIWKTVVGVFISSLIFATILVLIQQTF